MHHPLLPFLVVDRMFPASVHLCSCQYVGTASAEPIASHSTSAAGTTTFRIEPTSDVFSEPMSSSGRDSASATS